MTDLSTALSSYINNLQESVDSHYTDKKYRMEPPKFDVQIGTKYAKIIRKDNQTSVHSFVVLSDKDKKFQLGDILKANSFKSPARNFARGNVLKDGGESVSKHIYGL